METMQGPQPSLRNLLNAPPTRARLFEVARHFRVAVPQKGSKAELAMALAASEQVRLRSLFIAFRRRDVEECIGEQVAGPPCRPRSRSWWSEEGRVMR